MDKQTLRRRAILDVRKTRAEMVLNRIKRDIEELDAKLVTDFEELGCHSLKVEIRVGGEDKVVTVGLDDDIRAYIVKGDEDEDDAIARDRACQALKKAGMKTADKIVETFNLNSLSAEIRRLVREADKKKEDWEMPEELKGIVGFKRTWKTKVNG
jgi:hypothetical protein